MTTIERDQLKTDWKFLTDHIQKIHKDDPDVEIELFKRHKPVKGLCNQRRYFVIMGEYFLSYDMDVIVVEPELSLVGRSLQMVNLYDSFQEYESARVLQMSNSKHQTGLNLN